MLFQDPFGSLSPRLPVSEIISEGLRFHFPELDEAEVERRRPARVAVAAAEDVDELGGTGLDLHVVLHVLVRIDEAQALHVRRQRERLAGEHGVEALAPGLDDRIGALVDVVRVIAVLADQHIGTDTAIEHVVGVFRTLDMHIHSEDSQGYQLDRLADDLGGSGMELLNPPGVQGWAEDTFWLQEQWIISRARALSRYACWRLGLDAEEDERRLAADESAPGDLFAGLNFSGERRVQSGDYERMAKLVAEWPPDRLLDI